MDYEETMVDESEFDNIETDDTSFDGIVEEEDESEEFPSEEELEIPDEESEEEEEEEPEEETPPPSEPGWMKRRVQKAVDKAVAQALAAQQAEFDRRMMPIIEKMMEDEAQALVATRQVADIDLAREIVKYRHGQEPEQIPEQPRQANGQFAPKTDPVIETKVDFLAKQAERVARQTGVDVIGIFSKDEDIKDAVLNGDMDFYDVAREAKQKKRPPSPTRSPNGAGGETRDTFSSMSSEQFRRFEANLEKGGRYSVK